MTNINHLSKAAGKLITGAGALALIAGLNITIAPQAHAFDCLLDTNNDGNADTDVDTDGGADSGGSNNSLACGNGANAAGGSSSSTAVGTGASAAGHSSTALGHSASAWGGNSISLGRGSSASGASSFAVGNGANAAGASSIAVGEAANAGLNAIAIGADGNDSFSGANAAGDNSIVIGVDASDGDFAGAIVIGKDALATEADQVILKDAATFTILGNGDVGLGTAAPMGSLDINSGATDTTLLLTNSVAQWELKSKASTGRLNFKNITAGGVPFKLGPNSVNGLLSVGTAAADVVEVRGDLDVTGTLTTGGPTCGGGCDAVFDADYDLPSIEEHAAQMYAKSYLPEIGPTVPHAPVNISEQYGRVINELEKAHIYIAQLETEARERDQRLEIQNTRLERLEALY